MKPKWCLFDAVPQPRMLVTGLKETALQNIPTGEEGWSCKYVDASVKSFQDVPPYETLSDDPPDA